MVEAVPVSPAHTESRGEATANLSHMTEDTASPFHTAVTGVHPSTCQVDS